MRCVYIVKSGRAFGLEFLFCFREITRIEKRNSDNISVLFVAKVFVDQLEQFTF